MFRWRGGAGRLHEAIANLPEMQRRIFMMRYYDSMKYSEMSLILSVSEGALKASYHIAVKKIRQMIEKNKPLASIFSPVALLYKC